LQEAGGNITHAAKLLGVSLRGLHKRLSTLGIDASRFRG
jgi:transcriptional regulator of acetoin/glycerol metabolism